MEHTVRDKRKAEEDVREDSKRQKTPLSPEEIRSLMAEIASLKEENAKLDQQIESKQTKLSQSKGAVLEKDIDDELKDMFSSESEEDVSNPSTPGVSSRARRVTPKKEVSPYLALPTI